MNGRCTNPAAPRAVRAGTRILTVALLAAASLAHAETNTVYPLFGRVWTEAELRPAYERIRTLYAVDEVSRKVRPSGELEAFPIDGTVTDVASGQRIILETRSGLAAIRCADSLPRARGERLSFVVRRTGAATMSYVDASGSRVEIPDYKDHTLSFGAFVTSLQRGFHYPELPELGTKAHRNGLFRTKRPDRNVIADP